MAKEPPPFQEANRCDVCKCSFTTFRRRHHCRCCGKTLCYEHSSNQMPLPQFGIHSNVRVCSDCFNDSSRLRTDDAVTPAARVDVVTGTVSRLENNEDSEFKNKEDLRQQLNLTNSECKCDMPLCICVASVPEPTPMQHIEASSQVPVKAKSKRADAISRNKQSTPDIRQNSSSVLGPSASGLNKPRLDYEVDGEGLREAIKNGDIVAVNELLSKGVDSNYRDKQGFSLLHLAAVFNQTDIALSLMDHGARLDSKDSQGETPLDCAPATLQYKMRKKMEEASR
ncbi:hypothetical protein Dimus_025804 [Dionaea muscipula]